MFRRLRVIVDRIKKDGFSVGVRWLFVTIIHRIVPHRQMIWCVDLTSISNDEFIVPGNIKIKRFTSRDQIDKEELKTLIESGTELMGSAASDLIDDRFNKGAVLWLIEENGSVAGYKWTIVKDWLMPTYVPHTDSDVHEFGSEIFKGFRGRNILQLSTKYVLITLKNEGFKRYYSESYLWNKPAINAFSKTDYRKIGIAKRFGLFGRNVVIWYDMSNKV